MSNDVVPFYTPGGTITAHAAAGLSGKTFCDVTADIEDGPLLSLGTDYTTGGNLVVNTPTAASSVFGVVGNDCNSGDKVQIFKGPGMIVPVIGVGSITHGDLLEVTSAGKVQTRTSTHVVVGRAMTSATDGQEVMVELNNGF